MEKLNFIHPLSSNIKSEEEIQEEIYCGRLGYGRNIYTLKNGENIEKVKEKEKFSDELNLISENVSISAVQIIEKINQTNQIIQSHQQQSLDAINKSEEEKIKEVDNILSLAKKYGDIHYKEDTPFDFKNKVVKCYTKLFEGKNPTEEFKKMKKLKDAVR